ncbi:hypothetical protein HAX54_039705, partial [Datura stramonium]|nr:hypothetical protein [Datura stramonium]
AITSDKNTNKATSSFKGKGKGKRKIKDTDILANMKESLCFCFEVMKPSSNIRMADPSYWRKASIWLG